MEEQKRNPAQGLSESEQVQVRRQKLADLQAAGNDPFTLTKFPQDAYSADLKEEFKDLPNETDSGKKVALAGRMMSKRVMGKASFAHLRDDKGDIQLYVRRDELGDEPYAAFKKLDLGDIIGIKGEAKGYVTLVLSDKIRTLLKMIPLPRKMSATPDQQEEFNLYAYLKQLIDGNDVSVLLRVADEVVSVMDVLQFYMPTIKDVSTGLKLALELIRKFLPDGAFSRIYVDEQPTESGSYVAGAVALESGDVNTAGVAMFRIKPKTEGVRAYWAQEVPETMTVEEAQNYDLSAVLEVDGQPVPEGKISYTYKKGGWFGSKSDTLPTQPGEYVQTATVGGNYSCEKITRTIVIQ